MTDRVQRNPKTHRLGLVAVIVCALFALSSWALSSPVGSSPDDNFHLSSIWCGQGDRVGLCESVKDSPEVKKVAYVAWHAACFNGDADEPANCSNIVESHSGEMAISNHGNFTGLYPGGFYSIVSIFTGENVPLSTLVIRIFNSMLFVGFAFLVFLLSPLPLRRPLAGSLLFSLVPLGTFLIPSTNPSSWAITALGMYWISLLGFLRVNGKKKIALGITSVVLASIGASARADTALMLVLVSAIVIFISWSTSSRGGNLKELLLPTFVSLYSLVVFFLSGQAAVTVDGLDPGNSNSIFSGLGLVALNLVQVPELWFGALGTYNLGWLDTPLPALVSVAAIVAYFGLLFWTLGDTHRDQKEIRKINYALVAIGLSLVAYPTYVLVKSGAVVGTYFQPRYLLPLMTIFLGLAILRKTGSKELTLIQVSFLYFCIVTANSLALYTNLKRYVQGLGSSAWNLDENPSWWWAMPVGPMSIWLLGTLTFALVAWFICYRVLRIPGKQKKGNYELQTV